ncbi:radical SAM family heme chaperone HemW [Kocuria flava]|uniref:radical SAM family heme chaperone HemW n=1 Tax=Kocuria flava TaxID=446860 RepID=UPI001FF4BAA0|nr:radical SAM family heme chaperone HemW [Kocuria flava]MCJ8503428.1 radical SAM family heme chaperone HemW [Kocuria flava]
MAPAQPEGLPAPLDGRLPASAAEASAQRTLSLYVHVPFCAVRCGYCDFNTYTAVELGPGVSQDAYAADAAAEVRWARRVLEDSGVAVRPLHSVFLGGGTPTLLPAEDLAAVLAQARASFGLAEGAEVTTEANPDSVTPQSLAVLAAAGVTRVSFGMQSAVPHVLAVLDRTHDPDNVPRAVAWAREAGLGVSVDLIHGTPGESLADWERSVRTALSYEPDHVSAYALIIEDGTRLAARMRRGEVPPIDEDDQADKYELADRLLAEAGYEWYEVSNWARPAGPDGTAHRSRHNLAYWHNQDWWGIGPGAHSHVGGTRWWNLKHPVPYTNRVRAGHSPAAGREVLDAPTRRLERVMLEARIRDGLPVAALEAPGRAAVAGLIADGLVDPAAALGGRVVLTLRGRLLGDAVVRRLLG